MAVMTTRSSGAARTREIARGEAMREIHEMIRGLQRAGKAAAGVCECGCCGDDYRRGRLAVQALEQLAGYAFDAWAMSTRPELTLGHWSMTTFGAAAAAIRAESAGGPE